MSPMESETVLSITSEVKSWMESHCEIVLGLVYGSLADGRFHQNSDVDVGILCTSPLCLDKRIELSQELGKRVSRNVDLLDLAQSSGLILKEALTNGIRLKNTDPDRFAALLMKFYLNEADYGPMRDRAYKERRERVFGT